MTRRTDRRTGGTYVLLMLLAVLFAGPLAWLLIAVLKTQAEWVAIPTRFLPEAPQWGNVTAAVTQITLIPTYVLFARLGLVNTYWPWVFWGLAASPYLVFLFRQFFAAIPRDLEDAAIIDGCGYGRIFLRIFLPLSVPVLLTSFLLSFTWMWGDYLAPALLLDIDHTTLSVAITQSYRNPHGDYLPTVQAAAAALYVVPVMVVFLVAQRYFVRSVATSGVKG